MVATGNRLHLAPAPRYATIRMYRPIEPISELRYIPYAVGLFPGQRLPPASSERAGWRRIRRSLRAQQLLRSCCNKTLQSYQAQAQLAVPEPRGYFRQSKEHAMLAHSVSYTAMMKRHGSLCL